MSTSNRFASILAIGALAAWTMVLPALAAEADWRDCLADYPERTISGCSRIIAEAKEPPNSLSIAYNNRALALKARGELMRAFGDYTEALRLNPAYAGAYYNRGLAFVDVGSLARALDDFDAAIQ